ncbi:MAG: hypothetical protein O7G30_03860 [Proteobacteria bacterium]|nr:hypothetical protein [Pseudomonadota bacterium]
MLACFLAGIFFGSLLVAPSVDRHRDPLRLLATLEFAAGGCDEAPRDLDFESRRASCGSSTWATRSPTRRST